VFDHTSIPKTILTRFADATSHEKAFKSMGKRTRAANDLGDLLPLDRPRAAPVKDLGALAQRFIEWKAKIYTKQYMEDPTITELTFGMVSDLQAEIIA
jgi:hypothetical protein